MSCESPSREAAARLPKEVRRGQLVEIGLKLLAERPIHELSLDTVADQAGLSRSLLFHYFPTKAAFYAAVVEAAVEHLLDSVGSAAPDVADFSSGPDARLRAALTSYVEFVLRHRASYSALVRRGGGADPTVHAILTDARAELAGRFVAAGGLRTSRRRALAAQAWVSAAEELVLSDGETVLGAAGLVDVLVDLFGWMVARFDQRG